MEDPVENSPLGVIHCEAGCQLERKMDVLLTGCVLGNEDRKGQEGVCQFVIFTVFFSKSPSGLAILENTCEDHFLNLVTTGDILRVIILKMFSS